MQASNAGLKGGTRGKPQPAFAERMRHFFPLKSKDLKGAQWVRFKEGPGYLRSYFSLFDSDDDEEDEARIDLDDSLVELFRNVHCLPIASATKPWTKTRSAPEKLLVVCNPRTYKIRFIGARSREKIQRRPVPLAKSKFVKAVVEHSKSTQDDWYRNNEEKLQRAAARQTNTRRSAKSKNRRQPPKRHAEKLAEDQVQPQHDSDDSAKQNDAESDDEVKIVTVVTLESSEESEQAEAEDDDEEDESEEEETEV